MFKRLFGFAKKDAKVPSEEGVKVRRTIPLPDLDERERSMLVGFQMLSANVADPDISSVEDIVQFYREAQICGKTDIAVDWMMQCLAQRPGEDFHSERRQVLAECIASLMGHDDFVENLNNALDQGASEPNQRMIERAKTALQMVCIMKERRCVESLTSYNPLGKSEHDLWFLALSRVPDDRCAATLLRFLRRGRLFVSECGKATEVALLQYGPQMDPKLLKEFSELDGISIRALKSDGSYTEAQPLDCSSIRRLAAEAMRLSSGA